MTRTIHLIDLLTSAGIQTPGLDHVAIHPMTILRDSRMALFEHPDAAVEFTALRLGHRPRLQFACGLKQVCWNRMASAVLFRVLVRDREQAARVVFSMELDPRHHAEHRRWRDFDIDLTSLAHEDVALILQTTVPSGSSADYCWAGWADPCVVDDVDIPVRAAPTRSYPLVLMITADALRPDFMGCYGNTEVRTPHLDQLARDGALFRHARAQTGATVGSYEAMLTGCHPSRNGLLREWSQFPSGALNLPQHLRACGFHTLIAASEAEVGDPGPGFARLFDEQIPCLARPAQDGSITTRQFLAWLDRRPDKPCFAWLEYFDTHPPATPPEPFRSMYYQGDPSDPRNEYLPEAVAKIRGMEGVQEVLLSLPLLEGGSIDTCLHARLRGVLDFFNGRIAHGPDLASHITSLGAPAMGGRTMADFTPWLAEQLHALDEGIIPAELIAWLKELLPKLREIETDILAWLDGVVDYRFPVSQYKGCVSYLDHQVGEIISALKERGLYDSATIVFTSPHGELFGEHGVHFHHHLLAEQVLRIPMILKPAANRLAAGTCVDGVFDSIDLFPTLMHSLDLPSPGGLDGVERWSNISGGRSIAPHDSYAADLHDVAYSIVSGDFKMIQATKPHYISSAWNWKAGDRALFDLRDPDLETCNRLGAHPRAAAEMTERLAKWHHGLKAMRSELRPGLMARLRSRFIESSMGAPAKS